MPPKLHRLLLLLLLHINPLLATPPFLTDHHFTLHYPSSTATGSQRYLDPAYPTTLLPSSPPSCVVPVLTHSFADTYGRPPATARYAPPPACPPPWAHVVLSFSAFCAGDQYDRVAAVWLDGAELLRTTTAEPTASGVFWTVRKDVTRFSSLLHRPQPGILSVMLENIVNEVFTGIYHVNVSLEFYRDAGVVVAPPPMSLFAKPADLIVPVSEATGENGYWFRIQNVYDVHSKRVVVPRNTYRAVLEIFVSFHSNDEFWYSNPPDSYIRENNLTTGRGSAAYREVVVSIDGRFVGSVVPFPVIFTGGINPLFWQPVVALGAFDLPSYALDLTPFVGVLLDGKPHEFGIGVVDGIAVWLVAANLHLWLDPNSLSVSAQLVEYHSPSISISRHYSSHLLNGRFKIHAERGSYFSGWVNSSLGNLTTEVYQKLKFRSLVEFSNDGKDKIVDMEVVQKNHVRVGSEMKEILAHMNARSRYPLRIVLLTVTGENDTYTSRTNLSHGLHEEIRNSVDNEVSFTSLHDQQDADGWMLVHDHDVLSGSAGTQQVCQYSDDDGFYKRIITARDGVILNDNTTKGHGLAIW